MTKSVLSTVARTRATVLVGSVLAGLLAVTACGDDDETPQGDGGESGGSPGTGGKGSGGSPGTGGKGSGGKGDGGSGTGGTGSGGQDETGGTDGGGSGGDVSTGGTDGGPDGGQPEPWETGTKSENGADPAKEDRYYVPVFDADGNVYTIGYVNDAGNRSVVVAKYGQNGVLVTSGWGTNGVVKIDINPYAGDADNTLTVAADDKFASAEEGRDLAFQSNGKLVIAAVAEEPGNTFNRQIIVYRLNTDGTPDNGFGTAGKTVVDWSPTPTADNTTNDTLWGLDVDSGDKIYLFGSGRSRGAVVTTTDRFVTRLKASGLADETFASNAEGTFTIDTPSNSANPPTPPSTTQPVFLGLGDNSRHGFALAGGGVMASGYTNVGGRNQVVLWKLTEAGTRDTSFSGDGISRSVLFPNGMAEAYGAAVLSDGTFVTTGYGQVNLDLPSNLDMVSIAIKATGEIDTSFGVNGTLAIDLAGSEERGRYAMALEGDRILMTGGGSATAGNKDAMLVLLERNGTPVGNFGTEGRQLYDYGSNEEFYGAAISKDGKWIAAAGYTSPATATEANGIVTILPVGE